jgi:hypothetical protein
MCRRVKVPVRRLGAVIWLALRPLPWFRRAHSTVGDIVHFLVTIGLLGGALTDWLPAVPLPGSLAGRVAIVLAVLLVLMTGAAYHLQVLRDRRPRIIVTRKPYSDVARVHREPRTSGDDTAMVWYLRMDLANQPQEPSPDAGAFRVWARLAAFNEDRTTQYLITASEGGEVFGRWMVPPPACRGLGRYATNRGALHVRICGAPSGGRSVLRGQSFG